MKNAIQVATNNHLYIYNTNSLKDTKVDELKLIFLDHNSTFNSISKIKSIEETLKIEKTI